MLEYMQINAMTEFGRYEVIEEIGRGAMGAVFKANDPVMERVVAIKTILAAALAGPQAEEYRERFKREARAAGRLSHPGVVTVYDVGVQEGTPYLVMEFVPCRTLEKAFDSGDRFTLERTLELGQQLASALAYAHKNGVVHRDVKPANILLTADTPERAKITDFGVAKLSAAQATSTGALLGTPAFMAPEQFTGMGVDGRSDLFSLGVVLYWMATGDKPFSGDTITAVSYKIVHTEPIPPRTLNRAISPALESVLLKCLEKDPAQRYQSGELLAQDLGKLREGRTTASQISAMQTVASAPPAMDPEATIPLAAKAAPGMPAAATSDTQETLALSSAGPARQSRIPSPEAAPVQGGVSTGGVAPTSALPADGAARGSSAASPEVRVAKRAAATTAGPGAVSPSPTRSGSSVPASGVPPRPQPQPRPAPRSSSSRYWMIAAAALLILGVLWGAGVVKQKRDEAAATAALAAQREAAAKAHATKEAHETKKQEAAERREEKAEKLAAKEKAQLGPPSKPNVEKAKEEPREEPQPDISNYALRLEIYAAASTTVEVQPDDRPAASRLLNAGRKMMVGADKVFLVRTDNAGALKLKMNDRDLAGLGPLGAPRTVRLTARDLKATLSGGTDSSGGGAAKSAAPAENPAPRGGQATLQIAVANMPKLADIIVWVDDKPIFRQNGTGERGFATISEQRRVAPGNHVFRVYVGSVAIKKGIQKTISGDFAASESKTLRIETRFRGMAHDVSKLGLVLTLK